MADLIRVTGEAVRQVTRFRTSWVAWFDPHDTDSVRVLAGTGVFEGVAWETALVVPRRGDRMLEEIALGRKPVVVTDARTDPRTNKEQVARFGNHTIINVPVILAGEVSGALGVGSFGDEGVVPPTQDELEALVLFASQLGPAFDRVQALEAQSRAERDRRALELRLERLQRVELMGVLAAGVAHDLNNLIAIAQLSLDVIDATQLKAGAEALDDATNALTRMGEISAQLLQLGRSARGARAKVDLNELVARTLELVRPSLPRGVGLVRHVESKAFVDADAVQLQQALTNLVVNARDAVGAQGLITVTVDEVTLDARAAATLLGAREGVFAVVRVRDDGPGITRELQRRVFDPLFTTKETGSGLGLAVVTRAAAQHEGFVALDSEPGAGACFSFYLPLGRRQ